MAAKPIVDGIESEHGAGLTVIRLNVQDQHVSELADEYEFQFTPTFILFDPDGEEVERWVGAIDSGQVRDLMAGF